MRTEDVLNLLPQERFLYWVRERHDIFLARQAGKPKPWTDDEILQNYFFTNPYRENDRVTAWFRENLRDPLRDSDDVMFATVAFRWFNLPETGQALMSCPTKGAYRFGLFQEWNEGRAKRLLRNLWDDGRNPVFTGAYMIMAGPGERGSKIDNVCRHISLVYRQRKRFIAACKQGTLEAAWRELIQVPYLGGFMAYEVVTDLRHTALLQDASDVMTWANPGPGAIRGLNRLHGRPLHQNCRKEALNEMRSLLVLCHRRLPKHMPSFELREVEHASCEWDKYERLLWNDGMRAKRRYNGLP